MTAPMVVDGASFLDYVRRYLAPTLTPRDIAVIDDLNSPKSNMFETLLKPPGLGSLPSAPQPEYQEI